MQVRAPDAGLIIDLSLARLEIEVLGPDGPLAGAVAEVRSGRHAARLEMKGEPVPIEVPAFAETVVSVSHPLARTVQRTVTAPAVGVRQRVSVRLQLVE